MASCPKPLKINFCKGRPFWIMMEFRIRLRSIWNCLKLRTVTTLSPPSSSITFFKHSTSYLSWSKSCYLFGQLCTNLAIVTLSCWSIMTFLMIFLRAQPIYHSTVNASVLSPKLSTGIKQFSKIIQIVRAMYIVEQIVV